MFRYLVRKFISRDSIFFQTYYILKALFANVVYGWPSRKMLVIGVTGTDGKTTTCHMIQYLLREQGLPVCMSTSSHFAIKDKKWRNPGHLTSHSPFTLQKFLKEAKKKGSEYAVIEVASHGIHQRRIFGIPFDIVLLTNISHEHLDYHKTMEEYKNVKKKLFRLASKSRKRPGITKTAIVNGDCEYAKEFLDFVFPHKYAVLQDEDLEFKMPMNTNVRIIKDIDEKNMTWKLRKTPDKWIEAKLNIPGAYNIENASLALCVVEELKIDYEKALEDLKSFESVPGRMEEVECDHPARIIIDFGLTPKAMELTLKTLRNTTPGKLIHVFGACGDRDKTKRPILGEISAKICDLPIITDDEPYSEDPKRIMESIAQGCEKTGRERINLSSRTGLFDMKSSYGFILDRRSAIAFALHLAKEGDTIAITGMGDLEGRIIKGQSIPWSDRGVVMELAK